MDMEDLRRLAKARVKKMAERLERARYGVDKNTTLMDDIDWFNDLETEYAVTAEAYIKIDLLTEAECNAIYRKVSDDWKMVVENWR